MSTSCRHLSTHQKYRRWMSSLSLLWCLFNSLYRAPVSAASNLTLLAQVTNRPDLDRSEPLEPLIEDEVVPQPPDDPDDLLPGITRELTRPIDIPDELTNQTFEVTQIIFENNTLFSDKTLEQALKVPPDDWTTTPQTASDLIQLAEKIAAVYHKAGYTSSGALIRIPEITQLTGRGDIIIQIIEGELTDISLSVGEESSHRLRDYYIRSRLGVKEGEPLNVEELQESLQLLQLDPLISGIRAELNAGTTPGSSLLTVNYNEAPTFDIDLALNNARSPSIGSIQREVTVTEANLFGLGDRIALDYANTDGSNSLDLSYSVPINPDDGTLSFRINLSENEVIESPFGDIDKDGDDGDISSDSETYEISLRQPLVRSIKDRQFQELAVGLRASLRNSQSFLLDEPFPFSAGVEVDGETKIFALRLFQDWTLQDAQQVLALRSEFSLGLDAFGATVNGAPKGVERLPDSQFFTWRGQAQWVRSLSQDSLLILKGSTQLAAQELLSAEQFGIGGFGSVRGYRQDELLTDNGLFASAEARFPVLWVPEWNSRLQLTPFADIGTGWNHNGPDLETNTLASVGLGLLWQQSDRFTARLDWGIPLISVGSRGDTLQESGLYFSLNYNLF